MTRISNILVKARDTLADPDKERWSDERLIRLVDEAQKDISRHSKILKDQVDIPLAEGQHTYDLPDDVWLITRAAFDACVIPFYSHEKLDFQDFIAGISSADRNNYRYSNRTASSTLVNNLTCWEVIEGPRVAALVFDRRNLDEIRVFPIPSEDINTVSYAFVNAGPVIFAGDERMGIVTDMTDYTFDSVYGCVTGLFDPEVTENFLSIYGVVTDVRETRSNVHLWYIREAKEVTSINDELEISSTFDAAIRYYVIAHAFLDDIDTGFRERGASFMDMYSRELGLIQDTSANDGVRASHNRTNYWNAFE